MSQTHPLLSKINKHRNQWYDEIQRSEEDVRKIIYNMNTPEEIKRALKDYFHELVNYFIKFLRESVEEIIEETLEQYSESAPVEIDNGVFGTVFSRMINELKYGSFKGKTLIQRAEKLKRRVRKNVRKNINEDEDLDRDKILENIWANVYHESAVQGGRLYNQGDMLLTGEQTRFYYNTALTFCSRIGVNFIKILPVTNSSSKCKELAQAEPTKRVKRKCWDEGIDPSGVYPIEEPPEFPHPRAMFIIKPLYELGYSPVV